MKHAVIFSGLQPISVTLLFSLIACVYCSSCVRQKNAELTMDEIIKRIKSMTPADEDFRFHASSGWSENLLSRAEIVEISTGECIDSAAKIIDGRPATTWQSQKYDPRPTITIDLGQKVRFNRVVIFNRHTESRGTGGGNNATKELTILFSRDEGKNSFEKLGTFQLSGPKAVCFKKKGGGQVCTFIDDTNPNIFNTKETEARLITLAFNSAYWGEAALKEWKSSVALSEFMLFRVE